MIINAIKPNITSFQSNFAERRKEQNSQKEIDRQTRENLLKATKLLAACILASGSIYGSKVCFDNYGEESLKNHRIENIQEVDLQYIGENFKNLNLKLGQNIISGHISPSPMNKIQLNLKTKDTKTGKDYSDKLFLEENVDYSNGSEGLKAISINGTFKGKKLRADLVFENGKFTINDKLNEKTYIITKNNNKTSIETYETYKDQFIGSQSVEEFKAEERGNPILLAYLLGGIFLAGTGTMIAGVTAKHALNKHKSQSPE